MSTTLAAAFRGAFQITLTDDTGPYTLPPINVSQTLANGTSANQADLVHVKRYSVTAASPISIDLNGALLMPNGDTANFAKMKWIVIVNKSSSGTLLVGGGSNPFTSWMTGTTPVRKVGPGAAELILNPSAGGLAVTASTADKIQVDADTGTVAFDLLLVGTSA
jgi:hypothetical protein